MISKNLDLTNGNLTNFYKFSQPSSYWGVIAEQSHCYNARGDNFFAFAGFFRPKHYLFPKEQLYSLFGEDHDVTKQVSQIYTNSVLETAFFLFAVGSFFRVCEIIGHRAKSDILKNTPKKYSSYAPVIHVGFEVAFLLTTMLVSDAININFHDYFQAKTAEYAIRGIGMLFDKKFFLKDYMKEVNSVALTNRKEGKDELAEFAILKSFMFAKNFSVGLLELLITINQVSTIAKESPNLIGNGLYIYQSSKKVGEYAIICLHNSELLYRNPVTVHFIQELGLSSGALAVDVGLMTLKYLGVMKDPNNFTIDPNYKHNLKLSAQKASDNTAIILNRAYDVLTGGNKDLAQERPVHNNYFHPASTTLKPKKRRRSKDNMEVIAASSAVTITPQIILPTLPENCAVLQSVYSNGGGLIFAVNVYEGAEQFNNILNNPGSLPQFNLLTRKAKNGSQVYELREPGMDNRLLGMLLSSNTAMDLVSRSLDANMAKNIKASFNQYADAIGKDKWQCIVLTKYVAKHQNIDACARNMTLDKPNFLSLG